MVVPVTRLPFGISATQYDADRSDGTSPTTPSAVEPGTDGDAGVTGAHTGCAGLGRAGVCGEADDALLVSSSFVSAPSP